MEHFREQRPNIREVEREREGKRKKKERKKERRNEREEAPRWTLRSLIHSEGELPAFRFKLNLRVVRPVSYNS